MSAHGILSCAQAERSRKSLASALAVVAQERDQRDRVIAAVEAEVDADLNMAIPCDCDEDGTCLAHRILAALAVPSSEPAEEQADNR